MEIAQQSDTPITPVAPAAPATMPGAPTSTPSTMVGAADLSGYTPLHTQTQSTLAPTSEYVRYLLLALPARYVPRGIFGTLFETKHYTGNTIGRVLEKVSSAAQKMFKVHGPEAANRATAVAYNTVMGVGSLALTASYSWTVYKDIKNIFSEAVAMEMGKPATQVSFADLEKSDNRIVQKTMHNFYWRSFKRGITDIFFFPAAMARSTGLGDLMVGGKALQAFAETWKRKTTMFEDLVTFINNKINPRNGLGQAISVGEIFDIYQHYCESYMPDRMFSNVVERGTGEGVRWAQSQPIFERITELMNLTYAYKHSSLIDPKTGHAVHQANFPLPKLVYLLGHDMIDVNKPAETIATIEIANRFGIPAVKEMRAMLNSNATLAQVMERFPIPARAPSTKDQKASEKNGVIAKGSTMQLDQAEMPVSKIDAATVNSLSPALGHVTGGVTV